MSPVRSFPPLATARARILILGSMPGAESLRRRQYYAYAHNQFWPIMGALFGAGRELPYRARTRALTARGVAVWDVLKRCERPGSLDGNIRPESEQANDLVSFLQAHPHIRAVFFNGGKAHAVFGRLVRPRLGPLAARLSFMRLPSTSPAHAALPRIAKLRAWRQIRKFL